MPGLPENLIPMHLRCPVVVVAKVFHIGTVGEFMPEEDRFGEIKKQIKLIIACVQGAVIDNHISVVLRVANNIVPYVVSP